MLEFQVIVLCSTKDQMKKELLVFATYTTNSFHQNFVQVYENDPAGTRVGDLSASDEDKGQRLSYTLVDSDNGMFTLVGNQLRKAKSADYETTKVHKVRVRVTDNGSPPAWVSDKAVCTAWLLRVVTHSFKQILLISWLIFFTSFFCFARVIDSSKLVYKPVNTTLAKKNRPLGLCIKSEHCSCHAIS